MASQVTGMQNQAQLQCNHKSQVCYSETDFLLCTCVGYVTLPGPPTEVHASEINRTFIVLSWTPPNPCGRAPLWYLIEKVWLPPHGYFQNHTNTLTIVEKITHLLCESHGFISVWHITTGSLARFYSKSILL